MEVGRVWQLRLSRRNFSSDNMFIKSRFIDISPKRVDGINISGGYVYKNGFCRHVWGDVGWLDGAKAQLLKVTGLFVVVTVVS